MFESDSDDIADPSEGREHHDGLRDHVQNGNENTIEDEEQRMQDDHEAPGSHGVNTYEDTNSSSDADINADANAATNAAEDAAEDAADSPGDTDSDANGVFDDSDLELLGDNPPPVDNVDPGFLFNNGDDDNNHNPFQLGKVVVYFFKVYKKIYVFSANFQGSVELFRFLKIIDNFFFQIPTTNP